MAAPFNFSNESANVAKKFLQLMIDFGAIQQLPSTGTVVELAKACKVLFTEPDVVNARIRQIIKDNPDTVQTVVAAVYAIALEVGKPVTDKERTKAGRERSKNHHPSAMFKGAVLQFTKGKPEAEPMTKADVDKMLDSMNEIKARLPEEKVYNYEEEEEAARRAAEASARVDAALTDPAEIARRAADKAKYQDFKTRIATEREKKAILDALASNRPEDQAK